MSYKSSSLNLWGTETKTVKLDIDAHTDRVHISTTGATQPLKIHPKLHLVDAVNGDITDE